VGYSAKGIRRCGEDQESKATVSQTTVRDVLSMLDQESMLDYFNMMHLLENSMRTCREVVT